MSDPSFMSLVLDGFILSDETEYYVDEWHASDSTLDIHEYLGMTFEEYSLWVSDPDAIDTIILARHTNRPLREAVNDNIRIQERLAARSDEARKLVTLTRWIASQPDR